MYYIILYLYNFSNEYFNCTLGRNISTIIVDMIRYIDENKNNFDLNNKTKSILFNKLKSILDHDHWYSLDERKQIFNKSCELYFLTKKQKKVLSNSLSHNSYDDYEDNDDGAYSDEDRRWCD